MQVGGISMTGDNADKAQADKAGCWFTEGPGEGGGAGRSLKGLVDVGGWGAPRVGAFLESSECMAGGKGGKSGKLQQTRRADAPADSCYQLREC